VAVYLGDCAALSFLQHIQDLIENEGGSTLADADISGISAMEEALPQQGEVAIGHEAESPADLRDLITVFFAAVRPATLS